MTSRIAKYQSKLSQIDGQLRQIETRQAQLSRRDAGSFHRAPEPDRRDPKNIAINEVHCGRTATSAASSGRVVEVLAHAGPGAAPGAAVLSLQIEDPDTTLTASPTSRLRRQEDPTSMAHPGDARTTWSASASAASWHCDEVSPLR